MIPAASLPCDPGKIHHESLGQTRDPVVVSRSESIMYQLRFQNRPPAAEPYITRANELLIGRDPACQLRLTDNGIGDRHALIERTPDGYQLRDLGTVNGTRVNGLPVATHPLKSGDEIELGSVRLLFEVTPLPVHGIRRRDFAQILAGATIALLIAGQVAVCAWVLREQRPPDLRVSADKIVRTLVPPSAPAQPQSPLPVAPALPPGAPPPSTPPATPPAPEVLPRMIQIRGVERTDAANLVTLKVRALAQVGEREVDVRAVGITVQFFKPDSAGRPQPVGPPQRVNVLAWENFTMQAFLVRFAAPPSQLAGYVVRTYYRQQPQDVFASSPALLATTSEPGP